MKLILASYINKILAIFRSYFQLPLALANGLALAK
jgi:hypothetical protein